MDILVSGVIFQSCVCPTYIGGQDGFVPDVMRVYPVSKKKVAADYHSNVNSVQYMAWWKDLNQKIKDTYGECIIVIDNGNRELRRYKIIKRFINKYFLVSSIP